MITATGLTQPGIRDHKPYRWRGVPGWNPAAIGAIRERQPASPPARTPAVCGTVHGYNQHKRNLEPACEPCKDARRAYRRELRARGGSQ